jgi:hypothetical protein
VKNASGKYWEVSNAQPVEKRYCSITTSPKPISPDQKVLRSSGMKNPSCKKLSVKYAAMEVSCPEVDINIHKNGAMQMKTYGMKEKPNVLTNSK